MSAPPDSWPHNLGLLTPIETFFGPIDTTSDALRVFELCRLGRLGRVRRRLHDKERKMIRSGSVFVFDEAESGIKRWTDGRLWSPSRILGNFLIYRELERRDASGFAASGRDEEIAWIGGSSMAHDEHTEEHSSLLRSKKLNGGQHSHKGRFVFKPGGLLKKTISAHVDAHIHHLVCYYTRRDLSVGTWDSRLVDELRKVRIPKSLVLAQNFRKSAVAECGLSGDILGESVAIPRLPSKRPQQPHSQIGKRRNSYPAGAISSVGFDVESGVALLDSFSGSVNSDLLYQLDTSIMNSCSEDEMSAMHGCILESLDKFAATEHAECLSGPESASLDSYIRSVNADAQLSLTLMPLLDDPVMPCVRPASNPFFGPE